MDILISGASVAGTALAFWLRHAGHAVTVVERAPAVRDGGYAIDVRGTALRVAERMGIADRARRAGTDTLGTSFVNAAGKRIATLPLGFGVLSPDDIEIMKGDLTRLLYDTVPGGVEWIFGDTVTALDQGAGGVRVTFARARRAASTSSWAPTACTPRSGRSRSARRSGSCTTSAAAWRSSPPPTSSASNAGS